MIYRRSMIELSILILFTVVCLLIFQLTSVSLILWQSLSIITAISLFILLDSDWIRGSIIALFVLFVFTGHLHLAWIIPLSYVVYHQYKAWTLLFVLLMFVQEMPVVVTGIIFTLAVLSTYLAYSTTAYKDLTQSLNRTRDNLVHEQLKLKSQAQTMIDTRQKDVDIAILSERNRISHQLHDAVGHSLARSILQIEAMKLLPGSAELTLQLDSLQDSLSSGMDNIRAAIHEMHHDSMDLTASIERLQNDLPNYRISLSNYKDLAFRYEAKVDILSIIKEAITNSIKHSNATHSTVILSENPNHIKVLIKDNGTDYVRENKANEGIGQSMMRQISQKYEGTFIKSYQQGYIVQLNLPKKHLKINNE